MSIRMPAGSLAASRAAASKAFDNVAEKERISHVIRRLGVGADAGLVRDTASLEDAIAASLDLSEPPVPMVGFEPPADFDAARTPSDIEIPLSFWFERMILSPRRIEERLVWFWHDHFATSFRKVRIPYLFWQQHRTVRTHAAGRFDELLKAIAKDPAMLAYLDGRDNRANALNENFAREVMELHTMGIGPYTQDDVVAAARSFSGWVIVGGLEDRRRPSDADPWSAVFVPNRHDDGLKTLLGVTGHHDMDAALAIMLSQPETAVTIASKLYQELIGFPPDPATASHLGSVFRNGWQIMRLVEEIVSDPAFVSDDAIRSKVRTPIESVIGLAQGVETGPQAGRAAFGMLDRLGFVPFAPPNPAGFPGGTRLLGPYQLAHLLDASGMLAVPLPDYSTDEVLVRLGLYDVSPATRAVLDAAGDSLTRVTLAVASPEYILN